MSPPLLIPVTRRVVPLRWVRAVNADGSHGEWQEALVHNMNEIPTLIDCIADGRSPIVSG
jgi:hypothetical protein